MLRARRTRPYRIHIATQTAPHQTTPHRPAPRQAAPHHATPTCTTPHSAALNRTEPHRTALHPTSFSFALTHSTLGHVCLTDLRPESGRRRKKKRTSSTDCFQRCSLLLSPLALRLRQCLRGCCGRRHLCPRRRHRRCISCHRCCGLGHIQVYSYRYQVPSLHGSPCAPRCGLRGFKRHVPTLT